MIKVNAIRGTPGRRQTDALALFVFDDKQEFATQTREIASAFGLPRHPFTTGSFTGKQGETLVLFPRGGKAGTLIIVGLGTTGRCGLETVRRASALAAKAGQGARARTLSVGLPDAGALRKTPIARENSPWASFAQALVEGAVLGLYRYDRYLSRPKEQPATLAQLTLLASGGEQQTAAARGIAIAQIVTDGTWLARDLENAPGNEIYPATLAASARRWGKKSAVSVRVLDERKIRSLRMGGLIGVSQGSARPPRFIIMEYNRRATRRGRVALVGKGVTFDSGGISLKPSASMAEMKMDMSGAATVIATLCAAARLKLPVHLIGLIPATENLPGGTALKPGDILTHYNGVTSEVDNTDAEGRLILADALAYADRYKPDLIIDCATLTGACVVALGHHATGMMGNDPAQMERLKEAGNRTYERVWELPLFEEYERQIKSDVADVKNVGGRWAGAITAGLFLKRFIGTNRWIHLDIAGTAMMEESSEYIAKGGSGVGVRLLIDFLRHWKKG